MCIERRTYFMKLLRKCEYHKAGSRTRFSDVYSCRLVLLFVNEETSARGQVASVRILMWGLQIVTVITTTSYRNSGAQNILISSTSNE